MPTTLPLTKREEEALKSVRKKLRNKVLVLMNSHSYLHSNVNSLQPIKAEDAKRNI